MRRKASLFLVMVVILMIVTACASDQPWRKAAVTTYELTGITIEQSRITAEALYAQKLITDAQLVKIKDAYNKARSAFIAAGSALKVAGKAEDAAKRDALLVEYDKLLSQFKGLAYELITLVNQFKK